MNRQREQQTFELNCGGFPRRISHFKMPTLYVFVLAPEIGLHFGMRKYEFPKRSLETGMVGLQSLTMNVLKHRHVVTKR